MGTTNLVGVRLALDMRAIHAASCACEALQRMVDRTLNPPKRKYKSNPFRMPREIHDPMIPTLIAGFRALDPLVRLNEEVVTIDDFERYGTAIQEILCWLTVSTPVELEGQRRTLVMRFLYTTGKDCFTKGLIGFSESDMTDIGQDLMNFIGEKSAPF